MPAARVTVKDRGWKAVLTRITRAARGKPTLSIGIHAEEGAETHTGEGITMAELGEIHEFGLGVPQRSFIGGWADENEDLHKAQLKAMAQAVVKGTVESAEQGLERLGVLFVAQVQKRMSDGIEPPSLVDGRVIRLIDTGQLRSSITFRVT